MSGLFVNLSSGPFIIDRRIRQSQKGGFEFFGASNLPNEKRHKHGDNVYHASNGGSIDFDRVNEAALNISYGLLCQWLPNGEVRGREYIALNPLRDDRNLGSFRINLQSGKWIDFATGDRGGDIISLVAYLQGCGQYQAALELANWMGVDHGC